MYSCWRADPLDRPSFLELREKLEKVAEKLPESSSSRADIIYINTSFPEEARDREAPPEEQPACSSSPSCSRRAALNTVVSADIHEHQEDEGDSDRYVVVISSNNSQRSPAVDTPLLSGETFNRTNEDRRTDETAADHSSSDTSLLL